jgi:glycosyltransferase involved in cell wall biosynthesis
MTAGRLIGPATFKKTNLLDTFVLCPMGVDKSLPKPKNLLLRSSIKNLREDDFVLIWTGGIWDWFDAQTIIRAMALIKDPSVKLVFLGTKHPNSIYTDETLETKEARLLATKLGLVDKTVFFLDGWIPYEQRGAYFMDADTAIYADKKSLETRFSHRTRVLDHFWASLPTICSQGDYMSEIIRQNDLGIVVENRDPHEFANAIFKLKTDKKLYAGIRQNLKKHREDFTWEKTLEPLVRYLDTVDAPAVRQQIIDSYRKTDQNRKLSMKRRIRHSARILLLGR